MNGIRAVMCPNGSVEELRLPSVFTLYLQPHEASALRAAQFTCFAGRQQKKKKKLGQEEKQNMQEVLVAENSTMIITSLQIEIVFPEQKYKGAVKGSPNGR